MLDRHWRATNLDTGAGNFFGPKLGKLQTSLKAAGYTPNEIDAILLTHIHTDHSGGWSKLVNGVSCRPLYVGKPDVDFWFDRANATRFNVAEKYFDEAAKTVKPYLDAKKSFSGKTALLPGITAHPTPDTPGHSCYVAASKGESIEFWGDIVHFASVQFPKPEITVAYDVDANAAAAQRKTVCESEASNFGSRRTFALSGVGHLRAADQGYAWVPVDYRWREP